MCDGAFLKSYLDDQFRLISLRLGRLEALVPKIDDLKAEIAGLRDDLAARDGRDDEDFAEARRRIAELEAQIAAGEGDLAAALDEVRGLRDRVKARDLDPAFPPAPPDEGPPPGETPA